MKSMFKRCFRWVPLTVCISMFGLVGCTTVTQSQVYESDLGPYRVGQSGIVLVVVHSGVIHSEGTKDLVDAFNQELDDQSAHPWEVVSDSLPLTLHSSIEHDMVATGKLSALSLSELSALYPKTLKWRYLGIFSVYRIAIRHTQSQVTQCDQRDQDGDCDDRVQDGIKLKTRLKAYTQFALYDLKQNRLAWVAQQSQRGHSTVEQDEYADLGADYPLGHSWSEQLVASILLPTHTPAIRPLSKYPPPPKLSEMLNQSVIYVDYGAALASMRG